MLINRALYSNLVFFATLMIVITLPYSIRISNYAIVLLMVIWVIGLRNHVSFRNSNYALFLIFASLYTAYLVGHFYSMDKEGSIGELEKKIPLVTLPLVFYTLPSLPKEKVRLILLSFVLSCFFLCIYCICFILIKGDIFLNGFSSFKPWDFIHRNFTYPVGIHPLYLSTYLNFSLLIIYLSIAETKNRRYKVLLAAIAAFLMLFNLLTLSRMGLAIMCLIFSVLLIHEILQGESKKFSLLLILLVMSFSMTLYFFNSTFKQRIDVLFSNENTEGSFNQRRDIWFSSVKLFKKNWLLGVGTGDSKIELTNQYKIDGYTGPYYNCHNEYLQTGVSLGILGIVTLSAGLIAPLILKRNNFLYMFFLFILALSFLTESMLSVQKGVVFYSFFNSFFAFWGKSFEIN